MTTLYLKYGTWNGSAWVWSSSKSFVCLDFDYVRVHTKQTGTTLRQVIYSNTLAKRKKWTVIIGANELYNTTNFAWIETFWNSQRWKLSTDNWSTESEVVIQEEVLEKERSGGHKGLPKVTIIFNQKNPD